MEQIYYTFCENGRSRSGYPGDGVRAASAGIDDTRARDLMRYASYVHPYGALDRLGRACNSYTDHAPISLRYCCAGETALPIVVHSVCAKGERPNYFAHLLTDLPQDFSPRDAVGLWESKLWQGHDAPSIPIQLDVLDWEEHKSNESIIDEEFCKFLQVSENVTLFSFLLHSWLHRQTCRKIVLFADPPQIVHAIWGVLRCLPKPMWKNMSFSTYEGLSNTVGYDITGFWEPGLPADKMENSMKLVPDVEVWCPVKELGDTIDKPKLEWEKQLISLCLEGDFAQIDKFWDGFPDEFGSSLDRLELFRTAVQEPWRLTLDQLGDVLHYPVLEAKIKSLLQTSETDCNEVIDEWIIGNTDNSRLKILLDGNVDMPLLRNLVSKRIQSDIKLIKMVLERRSPQTKFIDKFLSDIWEVLTPEKVEESDKSFFAKHAIQWYHAKDNQQRFDMWVPNLSVQRLSEFLKDTKFRNMMERHLANNEEQCKLIIDDWFAQNDGPSKLPLLLDTLEVPLLRDSVLKKIQAQEIEFIKQVLNKKPSQKYAKQFQQAIWESKILTIEKLTVTGLQFFRPHALSWFHQNGNRQEFNKWTLHSVEGLLESAKYLPENETINLCIHFCRPKDLSAFGCDGEKALQLAERVECPFAINFVLSLCEKQDEWFEELLNAFIEGILQQNDKAEDFAKNLHPSTQ